MGKKDIDRRLFFMINLLIQVVKEEYFINLQITILKASPPEYQEDKA